MIHTTLAKRYRIDAEIGRGGMGTIYRAHDLLLDRSVAVKVLNETGLSGEGRARLLREARAAARLNHPNIVSVYDAGEADAATVSAAADSASESGQSGAGPARTTAYIVMELVEGQSLYQRRPLPFETTVSIARQICAALEHAHAHGIIHRDLKPENVVITPDGVVKLMDFGLARSQAPSRATPEGTVLGTVYYLAPEQALGQPVDARTDLYALGVMLYELATGQLPFMGDDALIIISQHLHAPVPPPSAYRPDLPPALEAVILKLLAKDPAERFASAREAEIALAEAGQGHPPGGAGRHNLPIQLTHFIGREREMAEVRRLLAASRLVTLTGSGGCGKTRLALQVAETLLRPGSLDGLSFPDGIWLVELATISDSALVPQAVAALLAVREEPGQAMLKTLTDVLRPKSLLLILDNCEHLIEVCAQLADALLRACPGVRILASSREVMGISGETPFRVPSLSAPDPDHLPPPDEVIRFEAVRLFVDRALAIRPDFAFTGVNASAVAQICHRLDGLPLAVELAAARIRAMTAEQIAERLDDRFRLLTGGSRTALPRQQTLRALIDWSWELLSDAERTLLRRLSVFLGGWTLEAAEAVCADPHQVGAEGRPPVQTTDVLDLLTHLVDKSLVLIEEQSSGPRYRLLETIRQYARDKLLEAGEAEDIRNRHLEYYVRLAESAEPELRSAGQLAWLDRLETEHDNLRAGLKWSLHASAPETSLGLAGNLARFWYLHGYWREGRKWLKEVLAKGAGVPNPSVAVRRARAKALYGAGWLADEDGSEVAYYTESLALCRGLGDQWGVGFCLRGLGAKSSYQGNIDQAGPVLYESLAVFRELDDPWGIGAALFNLGWLVFALDESHRAGEYWEEALAQFRRSGDRWGTAVTLGALGYLARLGGDYARSAALSQESLDLFRALGDKAGIANSLIRLGNVAFRRGDYRQAMEFLEEGLALDRERGDVQGVITSLSFMGLVACYQGDYPQSDRLLGESVSLGREIGDLYNLPFALAYQALGTYYRGEIDLAEGLYQESLRLVRQLDDRTGIGFVLNGLSLIARQRGNLPRARELLDESLARHYEVGDKRYIANALHDAGHLAQAEGDLARAASAFRESLAMRKAMGDRQGMAESLEGVGTVLMTQPNRAARLLGAASKLRQAVGAPVPPIERPELDRALLAVQAALGEAAFAKAWSEGQALTVEQAIALALETEAG